MENRPLLSLCIPTYGVSEWVFPVLQSIYEQKVSNDLFEVVITDNGHNKKFEEEINNYLTKHENIRYIKTESKLFLNEIDSYKNAKGLFIKFVNHRTIFTEGALQTIIDFVNKYKDSKPDVYFANGTLDFKEDLICENFDSYVKNLSYYSSWSTGMGFWKEDFDKIDSNIIFNELFPHTTILFYNRKKEKYIINNIELLREIPTDVSKKGKYDLFYAFCVEYPSILLDLVRDGDLSLNSFEYLRIKNLDFICKCYLYFIIRKEPCSFDLSSYKTSIKVYYSNYMVKKNLIKLCFKKILKIKK